MANDDLAHFVEAVIAGGEGPRAEFKREFPAQARDLAHEAAAFASTDGGVILLGVDDKGEVAGLPDLTTTNATAAFKARVEGAIRAVEPGVAVSIRFERVGSKTVCVVEVPRGLAAIYYVDSRPYIRVGSESRPAKPAEVDRLFRERLDAAAAKHATEERSRLTQTIARLTDLTAELRSAKEERGARVFFIGGGSDREESPSTRARWKQEDEAIETAEQATRAFLVDACPEFLNDWDKESQTSERLETLDTAIRELRARLRLS